MTDKWHLAGDIRRSLRTIRNVWPATLSVLATSANEKVAGGVVGALVSAHVLDLRKECHHDLRFFTMLVLEQVNGGTIGTKVNVLDVDQLTRFLDTWALHLCEQMPDDAEQCAKDMHHHAERLRGMVRGDRMHRYQIGRCPETVMVGEDQLGRCKGMLWASMREGDAMLPQSVVCDQESTHTWQPWQWASLGKRIERETESCG